MLSLIRRNKVFFILVSVLGLLLRWYFLHWHYLFEGDSLVYGDIAKNWLQHGIYGITDSGEITPVNIRMPGYPAFLAMCFRGFGVEHYGAVVRIQALADFASCFFIAAAARRLWSESAGKLAFFLAATCPFTANYVSTPLPESLAILSAAVALFFSVRALQRMLAFPVWDVAHSFAVLDWILCGIAISAGIYLRPDGGLLLGAIGLYVLWLLVRTRDIEFFWTGVLLTLVSLAPLLPWTVRNWRTLHQLQPLAPFYAQQPGEYVPEGFNQWCRTWVIDFVSTMNVEWNMETVGRGEPINPGDIPERAYDSPEQKAETLAAIEAYNQDQVLTPEVDHRLAAIARQRIRAHPLRYYVALPLLRLADMWLRPRTELLNLQLDWWNWRQVPMETVQSLSLAALDGFYLLAAVLSLRRRAPLTAVLWLFILLRSALLATLPNPEQRYTLECFPAVLMLGAIALTPTPRTTSMDIL